MKHSPTSPTSNSTYLTIYVPRFSRRTTRSFWIALLVVGGVMWLMRDGKVSTETIPREKAENTLYLMEKAAPFLPDMPRFEQRVRQIAAHLQIPPEWLMTVMYAESRFDPAIFNRKGSGAVGLIQFMPVTARELDVSTGDLSQMNAVDQLDYVHRYFQTVRERYGEYRSLTDLYLAVLYPRARGKDPCYALYFRSSKAYKQNSGLDENEDGVVTVSDIDMRMVRLFPIAAGIRKKWEIEI